MKRGDIYWVNLDPIIGAEIRKKRPCVLIGASPINRARHTIVVIPLSSSPKANPPIVIPIQCMNKSVVAVCDQIRAIDKTRLLNKIESIADSDLKKLEDGLRQTLCL